MPGIFFLLSITYVRADSLAWELYREANWPACSTEARRLLIANPANETSRFLIAASDARRNPSAKVCSNLLLIASTTSNPELCARASLEAARILLTGQSPASAWDSAAKAFLYATDPDTFLDSLAILEYLYRNTNRAPAMTPDLEQQYLTCEPLLRHLTEKLQPPRPDSLARRIGTTPGRLIVAFYRSCIRPALGDRCSLSPSCSEYFLLSSRKHGLLGIPMIADRLVREPSVVSAARYPLVKDRHTVYDDPVEAHDFWMKDR